MIRALLIANRGEIARRVIRTAREMGVRTVAVYAPPDARAQHVAEADTAVAVDGYLAIDALVAAATRTGADAVHPGYGFLSERAPAAAAFEAAGITWVGPPSGVIELLGDKVRAKEAMAGAGVPTLSGDEATFPVLVKAAAGGGGRGMRLVHDAAELAEARAAASREAAAAFGDGTVFLERWVADPRHVEVQIIADRFGTVVGLGERECSIQRRHQKVVEESPSPGISAELRARMIAAATEGAAAVGYVGAGTWEFLIEGDEFFFLEVNTRLQVEHPVTEMVTGLDLVRLQLEVAAGQPLSIGDVHPRGHAIEVRVVAEDPAAGWMPSTGTLHRFETGGPAGVRADLGAHSGSVVTADYDSLLGKLIAHAPTREEAAASLASALDRLDVFGVRTNRESLAAVMREADFLAGRTTTGYLDAHPEVLAPAPDPAVVEAHAIAGALWMQANRRRSAPVLATMPSGWRNLRSAPHVTTWDAGAVSYVVQGDRVTASFAEGPALEGIIFRADDAGIDVELAGVRWRCACARAGTSTWVRSGSGQTVLEELPRLPDPGAAAIAGRGPTAPVPGTIISVEVQAGDTVRQGQTLVVLEAMKLEHKITAEADGVVAEVPVAVGDRVDAHQLLVIME